MFQTVLLKSANTEAAKPPGVDTLKRYRKSRHPVQNEMKKRVKWAKKRWKADYFGSLCVFLLVVEKEKNETVLLYWKVGVVILEGDTLN